MYSSAQRLTRRRSPSAFWRPTNSSERFCPRRGVMSRKSATCGTLSGESEPLKTSQVSAGESSHLARRRPVDPHDDTARSTAYP